MQLHQTASRFGSACAISLVASMRKPLASSFASASSTLPLPAVAADASGLSPTCGVRLARSMAASLLTVGDISADHRDGAAELQHRIGADLRHHPFHLRLHLALDLYHHTSDRYAHLVDLDRVGADLQLDALHRLVGDLAQIGLRADVAHFDVGGEIAHRHGAVHVAHADGRAVIT